MSIVPRIQSRMLMVVGCGIRLADRLPAGRTFTACVTTALFIKATLFESVYLLVSSF